MTVDVTGTTNATLAPRWRPAWIAIALSADAMVQLAAGCSVYDLTALTLLVMATVHLPTDPSDRDTVRLVAIGQRATTLLNVQDAKGSSVQNVFGSAPRRRRSTDFMDGMGADRELIALATPASLRPKLKCAG